MNWNDIYFTQKTDKQNERVLKFLAIQLEHCKRAKREAKLVTADDHQNPSTLLNGLKFKMSPQKGFVICHFHFNIR